MRKSYPTDLTDAEWKCLKSCFYASRPKGRQKVHCLRDIFDAIFYVLRGGCAWWLLPGDFAPWQTVYYHFRPLRLDELCCLNFGALRKAARPRVVRFPDPSATIINSQSVKTTVESAHHSGYDGHNKVKGRKRHLLVYTLGLPLLSYVTPADVLDRVGARCLLIESKLLMPRLRKIWADGAYSGEELAGWCRREGSWELDERNPNAEGFSIVVRRWVVERTFG